MIAQKPESARARRGFGLPVLFRYGNAFFHAQSGFESFRVCCDVYKFKQNLKGNRT
jgi:hypothetical protein